METIGIFVLVIPFVIGFFEFYEWLDDCPVQWVRGNVNMESITYTFMTPDEEVDE